jgi:hypothetical protein
LSATKTTRVRPSADGLKWNYRAGKIERRGDKSKRRLVQFAGGVNAEQERAEEDDCREYMIIGNTVADYYNRGSTSSVRERRGIRA